MLLESTDHKSETPSTVDGAENKTTSVDYTEAVLTILEILFTPFD
jgi:hypothetical protein